MTNGPYIVSSRSSDTVNNKQTTFTPDVSTFTFYIDKSSPTAYFVYPAHLVPGSITGKYKHGTSGGNTLDTISGTAIDAEATYYGSGAIFQDTQFRLWYLLGGTSYYYDGSGPDYFQGADANAAWTVVGDVNASTTPWIQNDMNQVWVSTNADMVYYIQARARDQARTTFGVATGNIQSDFTLGDQSFRKFIMDAKPPSIVVDTPAAAGFSTGSGFEIHGRVNGDLAELRVAASSGVVVRLFCEDGGGKHYWDWASQWKVNAGTYVAIPSYSLSGGTQTWSVTSNLPSPAQFNQCPNPNTFQVGADAIDMVGQLGTAATIQFTIDAQEGSITSTQPVNSAGFSVGFYGGAGGAGFAPKPINTFAGTASDAGISDIDYVQIAVSTGLGGSERFWNGSTGWMYVVTDEARWRLVNGTATWVYPKTPDSFPSLQSGTNYRVYYRVRDRAGNQTASTVFNTFLYDTQIPTVTLSSPLTSGTTMIKFLTMLSGTAQDSDGGALLDATTEEARIEEIQLSIQDLTTAGNPYWKAANRTWTDVEGQVWNSTTAVAFTGNDQPRFADPWQFTGSTPSWASGKTYRIETRVIDRAHNISQALAISTFNFIFDDVGPTPGVAWPADASPGDYATPRLSTGAVIATISGTAQDTGQNATGIALTQIRIFTPDISGGSYWVYGTDYLETAYAAGSPESRWFNTQAPYANWTSTFQFITDRRYMIETRSQDSAGNYSSTYATATLTIDRDIPLAVTTFPVTATSIKDLDAAGFIAGTAADGGSDADARGTIATTEVDIAIKVLRSPTSWYSQIADQFNQEQAAPVANDTDFPTASVAGSAQGWKFGLLDNTNLVSGTSYYITVRVRDNATPTNELSWNIVSATFTFDNAAPVVAIATPAATTRVFNTFTLIAGTAVDATSNVAQAYLRLQRHDNLQYWSDSDGDTDGTLDGSWGAAISTIPATWSAPNWTYTLSDGSVWAVDNTSYSVTAWALDVPGSTSAIVGPNTFMFDRNLPTATVTSPVNASFMTDANIIISGTADDLTVNPEDSATNISTVTVAVSSANPPIAGTWWNGTSFTATNAVFLTTTGWTPAQSPDQWQWDRLLIGPGQLTSGTTYTIRVKVVDKAGNPRTMTDTSFVFDSGEPLAGVADPADGNYKNTVTMIKGTAQDVAPGVIAGVEIAISTGTGGSERYWNWQNQVWQATEDSTATVARNGDDSDDGTGFNQTTELWKKTTGLPTWSTLADKSVRVYVWAVDSAGNEAVHIDTHINFTVDQAVVLSSAVYPVSNQALSYIAVTSGTISDPGALPSGVASVVVAIEKESNHTYWDALGDQFDPTQNVVWNPAVYGAIQGTWSFTAINMDRFDTDRWYRVKERGVDVAGNAPNLDHTEMHTNDKSARFLIDKTAPVSKSTAPALAGGATVYYNSQQGIIWGTATDAPSGQNFPSGLRQVSVRLSRLNSLHTREWYNWDLSWTGNNSFDVAYAGAPLSTWRKDVPTTQLLDGYRYEMQTQARDFARDTAGNFSNFEMNSSTAYFVIDLTTPTNSITSHIPGGATSYFNTVALASGTMSDPSPGGNCGANCVVSGVEFVYVELQDISDTVGDTIPGAAPYWDFNQSTWVVAAPNPSMRASVYISSWAFSSFPNQTMWERYDPLPDGRKYRLKTRTVDRSSNTTVLADTYADFMYDNTPATSTITTPPIGVPPEGATINSLLAIQGTAADISTATVQRVYVSIRNDPDSVKNPAGTCSGANEGAYWQGGSWGSNETWYQAGSYDSQSKVWSHDTSGVSWDNDCFYVIKSSAVDTAGNYQIHIASRGFKMIAPPAVTGVTVPILPPPTIRYYTTLDRITGTANGDTSEVRIEVRRKTDGSYWSDGAGLGDGLWTTDFTSLTVTGLMSWEFVHNTNNHDLPNGGLWVDGSSYTIRSVGRNNAMLYESKSEQEVRIDTVAPTTTIDYPGGGTYFNSLGVLSGTALDALVGGSNASGVKEVRLRIQRTGGGNPEYWKNNSSSWQATNDEPTATEPGWSTSIATWWGSSWTFTVSMSTLAWTNGNTYEIQAKAIDNTLYTSGKANEDATPAVRSNVIFDNEIPTATITSAIDGEEYNSIVVASGSVVDNFLPVANVKLYIYRPDEPGTFRYWDGDSWEETSVSTRATVYTSSWTFSNLPSDFTDAAKDGKRYVIWLEPQDQATNSNTLYSVAQGASKTIVLDFSGPQVAITNVNSNDKLRSLTSIAGTIVDPNHPFNSKVSTNTNVEVQIYYLSAGVTYYYNQGGSNFTNALNESNSWWNPSLTGGFTSLGPSSGSWTYNSGGQLGGAFLSDKSYTIRARGKDATVPNVNYGSTVTIVNVIIDTTAPTAVFVAPSDTVIGTLSSIDGTALGDLAGMSHVDFSIKEDRMVSPATHFFDGAVFLAETTTYFRASGGNGSGSVAWSSSPAAALTSALVSGNTYTVWADPVDLAGGSQVVTGVYAAATFLWDNVRPDFSVMVPSRAIYGVNNPITGIAGTALEAYSWMSSVQVQVRITSTTDFNGAADRWWDGSLYASAVSSWVSVGGALTDWLYPMSFTPNRKHGVIARAFDRAGNSSQTAREMTFIYDTTAPVIAALYQPSKMYHKTGELATLSGTVNDAAADPMPKAGLNKIEIAISAVPLGINSYISSRTNQG
ncbi:MAG: Ig-like domain repeat protein, partial [Elusimicrobiota bacterium]